MKDEICFFFELDRLHMGEGKTMRCANLCNCAIDGVGIDGCRLVSA
jgi:hypothetical protein